MEALEELNCQLCCIKNNASFIDNIDKPNHEIINNYSQIEEFKGKSNNKKKIFKLFYFYRNNIHEVLYKEDKLINIEKLNISQLSELFYLSLLLDNSNLIYFYYKFDCIQNLDDENKEEKKFIVQIIVSKIIIILIEYSKGLDYYYQYHKELEEIKNNNIEIIKGKLNIFNKEFNLKYNIKSFLNKKIDNIFMEIIISLIKKNKFDNMNYYEDITNQLNLESIKITKIIFDGLSKELDIKKNKFLENYIINEERLEDEKVKLFYKILFNTILKDPRFIYKNNFLMKNINKFSELLKNNREKVKQFEIIKFIKDSFSSQCKDKDDIKYINYDSVFSNSNFFNQFDKEHQKNDFKDFKDNSTSNINSKNENYENKRKRNLDINSAREILNNLKIIIDLDGTINKMPVINKTIFKYGEDYEKIINYEEDLYNIYYDYKEEINRDKKGNDEIKEDIDKDKKGNDGNKNGKDENKEEINKNKKEIDNDNLILDNKYKQFLDFWSKIKEYLLKSKISFNPRIILELKRIELKSGDFDMKCISSFENQKLKKIFKFTDNNILTNGLNGKNIGFTLLIQELSEDDYEGQEYTYEV